MHREPVAGPRSSARQETPLREGPLRLPPSAGTGGSGPLIDVRILGPVELRVGGDPLELSRVKERQLLLVLALHANEVLSRAELAAGLWEDASPHPVATLRVHVSRLRQALARRSLEAEHLIVTVGQGYSLRVPPEAVDASRFEVLAAAGRHELVGGGHLAAAATLHTALAEWRGPIGSDLTLTEALQPELVRLEMLRLSALEDRIEADLGCGRHEEVASELRRLVEEHPFRERLWGQLMVALCRSGRQTEALRAYTEIRTLLRDELGIQPGPTLRQLERAVLEQDAALFDPSSGPFAPLSEAGDNSTVPSGGEGRSPARSGGPAAAAIEPPVGGRPGAVGDGTGGSPRGRAFPNRLARHASPLAGRSPELAQLLDAWKDVVSGARRVVLVSGEAGIGKTRLVSELAVRTHEMGAAVCFGRCDEGMGVSFQPFVEALSEIVRSGADASMLGRLGGELVRLVPEIKQLFPDLEPPLKADPQTERYRLFDAVASWLATLSHDSGALLVLDDLQWAEKATLLMLRHLIRCGESMRLLVVGTYRNTDLVPDHPLTDVLADLRRETMVDRLALGGLDLDGVLEMIDGRVGPGGGPNDREPEAGPPQGRSRAVASRLKSLTNGNPFFLQEILRSLEEQGDSLDPDDDVAGQRVPIDREDAIPESVRDVVRRRVGRLPEAARAVLSVGAVVGPTIDFDVVVEVAGLSEDSVLDALDELSAAALLRETSSGSHEFVHDIVRSVIYRDLGARRRERRHLQVAESLERRSSKGSVVLAQHFRLARAADERAITYSVAAAEEATARLAFDDAIALLLQALVAADVAGAVRRCELQIRLGTAQRLAADAGYRETLLGAARLAQQLGETDLLAEAALENNRGLSSTVGVLDTERIELVEAALAAIGSEDSVRRARLLSVLALELVWGDPTLRRLELADEALALARRLGDEDCLLDVWTAAQIACAVADRVPDHVVELPGLLELAERIGSPQQIVVACGWGSLYSLEMGQLTESDRLRQRIGELASEVEYPFFRWIESNYHCCRLTVSGRGDEIEQEALRAFGIGQSSGQPDLYAWFAPQLFVARWAQGRLGEVVDLIRQASADIPGVPAWRAALALACAHAGEHDEAATIIAELMLDPARTFPSNVAWLVSHSVLAEVVARIGTAEQARREYELLNPYAGRVPCLGNMARPSVSLWLAMLAVRAGWTERAEQHFASAHEQHERLRAPVWLAHTRLHWGLFLAGCGDAERARALLVAAAREAEQAGATDVARAANEALVPHVRREADPAEPAPS